MTHNRNRPKTYQSTSCHQCKTRKKSSELRCCPNQNGKNRKKCSKKYCIRCLEKKYSSLYRTNGQPCPACCGICKCAYCIKASKKFIDSLPLGTGNFNSDQEYGLKSNGKEQFGKNYPDRLENQGDNGPYGRLNSTPNDTSGQYANLPSEEYKALFGSSNGDYDTDLTSEISLLVDKNEWKFQV